MVRRRTSLRLPGYDYTRPGGYYVTIVTKDRIPLFGRVVDGEMILNDLGRIVVDAWNDLPNHYPHVLLDAFIVMPDHVHGIVVLTDGQDRGMERARRARRDSRGDRGPRRHGLPEIVRAFKSFSARRINERRGTPGVSVWQRGYYDRILRTAADWRSARWYIATNPQRWEMSRSSRSFQSSR